MAPEYAKAAKKLEQEKIYLAQVDCTTQKKLAAKYQIRGFPTMKFFKEGGVIPYNGGRTEESIIEYSRKYVNMPFLTELKTAKELNDFKQKSAEIFKKKELLDRIFGEHRVYFT